MLVSCIKPVQLSPHADCSIPAAGLFAPRAGQNFRDEQRRRRSQYDRGTRLAEIEDLYETQHHDRKSEQNSIRAVAPYGKPQSSFYPGHGGTSF